MRVHYTERQSCCANTMIDVVMYVVARSHARSRAAAEPVGAGSRLCCEHVTLVHLSCVRLHTACMRLYVQCRVTRLASADVQYTVVVSYSVNDYLLYGPAAAATAETSRCISINLCTVNCGLRTDQL